MSRLSCAAILIPCFLFLLISPVNCLARSKVLFDQGHGQRFLVERGADLDLSVLSDTFRDLGNEVTTSSGPLTDNLLNGIDILLISGPFRPFSAEEVEVIVQFIERGGAVGITLHIAHPLTGLLHRLGVAHSSSVLHEEENMIEGNSLHFRVTRLESHPLFQGLQQFSLYGVWALLDIHAGVQTIAHTSPSAWVDLNGNGRFDRGEPRQSFAVTVVGKIGRGRFVVFGDDAIFQNRFLTGENLKLARNLVTWLASDRPALPSGNR